jgi:hypothetical protein
MQRRVEAPVGRQSRPRDGIARQMPLDRRRRLAGEPAIGVGMRIRVIEAVVVARLTLRDSTPLGARISRSRSRPRRSRLITVPTGTPRTRAASR